MLSCTLQTNLSLAGEPIVPAAQSDFWHDHYRENLGLIVWPLTPEHAAGVHAKSVEEFTLQPVATPGDASRLTESAEESLYPFGNLIPVCDRNDQHPIFLLRLQDDLDSGPATAKPAVFGYERDGVKGTEGTFWDTALLMEGFFPGGNAFMRYDPHKYAFRTLFGAEWERLDVGSDQVDTRRFLLAGQISGVIPGFLNRQPFEFGLRFEDDRVNDHQSWTLGISWLPIGSFGIGEGPFVIGSDNTFKDWFDLVNSTGERKKFAQSVSDKSLTDRKSAAREAMSSFESELGHAPSSISIRPKLGIDLGGAEELADLPSHFDKTALTWSVEVRGSIRQKLDLSYTLTGRSALNGDQPDGILHSFSAIYRPWRSKHGSPLNNLYSYVTYEYGDKAPTYTKVDFLKAGVAWKF